MIKKIQNYLIELDQNIGHGLTCEVYKAQNEQDKQYYAVKIMEKQQYFKSDDPQSKMKIKNVQREIAIHKMIQHNNIIKLYNYFESKTSLYLFMELADFTLDQYVKKYGLTQSKLKEIFKQIIEAFIYLGQLEIQNQYQQGKQYKGICHLDFKPQNILMKNGIPKISDFGISVQLNVHENDSNNGCPQSNLDDLIQTNKIYLSQGTLSYMSPEQLKGEIIQDLQKHDVFSAGVVFYELVYGKHPYSIQQTIDNKRENNVLINQITFLEMLENNKIQFGKLNNQPDSLINLLQLMLQLNHKNRITWKDCLEHPYFKN